MKTVPGRVKVAGKRRLRRSWQRRAAGFNLASFPASSQKQYLTRTVWTPEMSSTVRLTGADGRTQGLSRLWLSWYNAPNSKRDVSLKNEPFQFYAMSLFSKMHGKKGGELPGFCGTSGLSAGEQCNLDTPGRTRSSRDNESTHQWRRNLDRGRARRPGRALRV